MTERSPEQILLDEYKRLTRGQATGTSSSALLSAAIPTPKTSAAPSQPRALTPSQILSTLSAAPSTSARSSSAQTSLSPRQVNQGYTLPVPQPAQPAPSSGGSTLGTIGSTALKVFTSGLGIMPLISGLAGLFGGGKSAPPPPLVPYAMPRSIHIEAANSPGGGGSFQLADQGQTGTPRSYSQTPGAANPASGQGAPPQWPTATYGGASAVPPAAPAGGQQTGAAGGQQTSAAGAPQIVVNVSAMDSQSFLDRSHDIAQAVRQAMLSMSSLNDVVSEL